MVSDHTSLPDNGSRPVVDREIVSDLRTRMDIDTSLRMGHFSNHAGNKGDAQPVQLVRNAIVTDSPETGITKNNLVDVLRSGIAVESGFSIRCQQAAHFGKHPDKGFRQFLRLGKDLFFGTGDAGSISKTESCINLPGKQRMQRSDIYTSMKTDCLLADPCVPVITGEKDCPA